MKEHKERKDHCCAVMLTTESTKNTEKEDCVEERCGGRMCRVRGREGGGRVYRVRGGEGGGRMYRVRGGAFSPAAQDRLRLKNQSPLDPAHPALEIMG
ncbi:MAG: hypothetical protein PF904_00705 [Kiritimatiellae bacterium]|jgi:hypothetical protein|nr:hypothetical protein [Kiritimatiellia bacterium]